MRTNKFIYLKVLQEWNGEEWCDSVLYDSNDAEDMKELRRDAKSYRAEGIRVRVVARRVSNNKYFLNA